MPRIKVEITQPDRVLFPASSTEEAITNGDQRFPRSIDEQGFIQQDFAESMADWMASAQVAKEGGTVIHPLDDVGLARYVQTTGSRGLHVVALLRGDADFDAVRQFARNVVNVVAADDPAHRTVEARKNTRGGRVYARDVPTRLARQRDPWADIHRHARSLVDPTQRLARLHAGTA